MKSITGGVAAILILATAQAAFADDIDYSVTNGAPATLKVAGDGTVFVDYVNPAPGTYTFSLNVWVEAGGHAASFPTPNVPIDIRRLSGTDVSSWFSASPAAPSFSGWGTDPSPKTPDGSGYTGIPGGSYVEVLITFTIPSGGLPDSLIQVKIQCDTAGIRFLGKGHGIIVRFSKCSLPITITSWLSDSSWTPMSAYQDTFKVVTRANSLNVTATNPGSFYYNILVTTSQAVDHLTLTVDPIPGDFGLWGANAVHAWIGDHTVSSLQPDATPLGHSLSYETGPLAAHSVVFVTVHVQYTLATLPSACYLPKVYAFSGSVMDGTSTLATSAQMTGVRKKS